MTSNFLNELQTNPPKNFEELLDIINRCKNQLKYILTNNERKHTIEIIKKFLDKQKRKLNNEEYEKGCNEVLKYILYRRIYPVQLIETLIKCGADPNNNNSGLLLFCIKSVNKSEQYSFIDAIKILFENGANIYLNDTSSPSVLHAMLRAEIAPNIDVVRVLLAPPFNFNVDLRDKDGNTILGHAQRQLKSYPKMSELYQPIIDLLEEKGRKKAEDLPKQTNNNISDAEQPIKPKENTNFIRSIIDGIKSWSARAKNKISSLFRDFINFCKTLIFGDKTPTQQQEEKNTSGQYPVSGQVIPGKQQSPAQGNSNLINQ